MSSFLTYEEMRSSGFATTGYDVKISGKSSFYNKKNIIIGNNVRIDDFCILASSGVGKIFIGNNVHISAFSFINGLEDITIEDFVTLAPCVRVFSSSDDYSGGTMTGATLPPSFLGTKSAPVVLGRHSIIGTGSSVMPGVRIGEGTAVGAYSFVNRSTDPFTIVAGVPARFIKNRSRNLLSLESQYYESGK